MRLPNRCATPSLVLGALITLAIVVCAIFAPYVATHGVEQMDMRNRFAGPEPWSIWLGTDNFGRDLWSAHGLRRAHLARASRLISVGGAALIGTIVGLLPAISAAGSTLS